MARTLSDFFGTPTPDRELRDEVERVVKSMFDAVMDASLSPFSSPRIVIGTNLPGFERINAFIVKEDAQKRIFLTEQFFRVPRYPLKPEAAGFDRESHFQAGVLLHELSHLVLDTKDIAYLDSNAPYLDLLRESTAANVRAKASIQRMHEYRLSHRTRKNDLFTQQENGVWRDVAREDALGYSTVLRITGTKTLDEARTVFLSDVRKRSQIILKNADSVTLLILQLGRYNYAAPSP